MIVAKIVFHLKAVINNLRFYSKNILPSWLARSLFLLDYKVTCCDVVCKSLYIAAK